MYNVIIGLHNEKNGLSNSSPLNLEDKRELVIVDLDYLLENHESVLLAARTTQEQRDKDEGR